MRWPSPPTVGTREEFADVSFRVCPLRWKASRSETRGPLPTSGGKMVRGGIAASWRWYTAFGSAQNITKPQKAYRNCVQYLRNTFNIPFSGRFFFYKSIQRIISFSVLRIRLATQALERKRVRFCFRTFLRQAQRARDKHNCRFCGILVCDPCSNHRKPLPRVGVLEACRVCDRCFYGADPSRAL